MPRVHVLFGACDEYHGGARKPYFVEKGLASQRAMGQSSQNLAHFRQKVDMLHPRSAIGLLERSKERKARSDLAALSILLVLEAPHDLHRQRLVSAFVRLFPFISLPQTSYPGLLKAPFRPLGNFSLRKACLNRRVKGKADTLLETCPEFGRAGTDDNPATVSNAVKQ